VVQVRQVEEQVLDPEGGALADGGGLRRLEVGEAQAGLVLPLAREGRQGGDDTLQPPAQEAVSLSGFDA